MSEPASISAAIAGRYASAVFELAPEGAALDALEGGAVALGAALEASADLRELISSPLYTRAQQEAAVAALADKMALPAPLANGLKLMAEKRRLYVLPAFVDQLKALIADARGETTVDVTSASALSDAQVKELSAALSEKTGKTVKLNVAVDESLIGGMIVRLGSRMIDTSVRAKLASLQNAMKEVG